MIFKDYYKILSLETNRVSSEQIKNAYRMAAKKYHPDINAEDRLSEEKIKDINEAYHVLSDEFLREQYDAELEKEEIEMYLQKRQIRAQNNTNKRTEEPSLEERMKKHKTGSMGAIIELTKQLIKDLKNKEKRKKLKEMTKIDVIAIILTIIVVVLIGIALWFIPFTNGWMRELLFENPLFNWIGRIFS